MALVPNMLSKKPYTCTRSYSSFTIPPISIINEFESKLKAGESKMCLQIRWVKVGQQLYWKCLDY